MLKSNVPAWLPENLYTSLALYISVAPLSQKYIPLQSLLLVIYTHQGSQVPLGVHPLISNPHQLVSNVVALAPLIVALEPSNQSNSVTSPSIQLNLSLPAKLPALLYWIFVSFPQGVPVPPVPNSSQSSVAFTFTILPASPV